MKNLLDQFKKLPLVAKIILVVILIILLIVVYNWIKKQDFLNLKKDGSDTVANAKDELAQLSESGTSPNYSSSQFAGWSDSLQEAMEGVGTDEEVILNVFKYMKNKADVLALIKAFGIRDYTDDKFIIWNVKPFNLNQWLANELSVSNLADLNSLLKKEGINYTF